MHYKKVAAALKVIQRAQGNVDRAVYKIAEDVGRDPDKYTVEEKIRLWEYINKRHLSGLQSLTLSGQAARELERVFESNLKDSAASSSKK